MVSRPVSKSGKIAESGAIDTSTAKSLGKPGVHVLRRRRIKLAVEVEPSKLEDFVQENVQRCAWLTGS